MGKQDRYIRDLQIQGEEDRKPPFRAHVYLTLRRNYKRKHVTWFLKFCLACTLIMVENWRLSQFENCGHDNREVVRKRTRKRSLIKT